MYSGAAGLALLATAAATDAPPVLTTALEVHKQCCTMCFLK